MQRGHSNSIALRSMVLDWHTLIPVKETIPLQKQSGTQWKCVNLFFMEALLCFFCTGIKTERIKGWNHILLVTKLLMTQQDHYVIAEPSLLVVVFKADVFILSMAISLLSVLFSLNAEIFIVEIKIVLKLECTQVFVCKIVAFVCLCSSVVKGKNPIKLISCVNEFLCMFLVSRKLLRNRLLASVGTKVYVL